MIDTFLQTIQHITLNERNMLKYTQHAVKTIPKAKSRNQQHNVGNLSPRKSSTNSINAYPTQDDLFWCFYLIHLGFYKYETIHNYFTEEKKFKIELVELVRQNKDILKQHKWKRTQIEDELVHGEKISVSTFICLCVITKHSFVLIDKRKVFDKRIHSDIGDTHLIIIEDTGGTNSNICPALYTEEDKEQKMNHALETMWIIDNIKKPLRSIGSYKIKDLRDICRKLAIDIEKKKKKDLYQAIREHL